MSTVTAKDGAAATDNAHNGDGQAAPTSSNGLFVIPRGRGDGFQASIRGHILDLADPNSGHALAPTPNDLFIASIASGLAWSARSFLRTHRLPDDVSVSATWRTHEGLPGLADINLTVTAPRSAEALGAALGAGFADTLSAHSRSDPLIHISFEGGNR
jgi:putative redox protein